MPSNSAVPFCSKLNEELWSKAVTIHEGQLYGDKPYPTHLNAVREVLARFGLLTEVREQAAMFHDGLEDQKERVNESLMYSWGVTPAAIDIVQRVTDVDFPQLTRKERKALTYPKISVSEDAVIVKLADRIANVETGLSTKNRKKLNMYYTEQASFKKALFSQTSNTAKPLWDHLEKLLGPDLSIN
jgi:guanosine-3',5'-bis(diphosphate) 3'-pyrophosphohydrolase